MTDDDPSVSIKFDLSSAAEQLRDIGSAFYDAADSLEECSCGPNDACSVCGGDHD